MTRRDRVAVICFAVLGIGGILLAGAFQFARGDTRVLVVTLQQGVHQSDRQQLKDDCGGLPGVRIVPDKGNPDPAVQGRFPVRFAIAGTTPAQEAALESCVSRHGSIVRGYLSEGDR